MKYAVFAFSVLILVGFYFLGGSYYKEKQADRFGGMAREQAEIFVRPHSEVIGNPEAKVLLIEFMDPACETCSAFAPLVKQIMDAHPGRIQLVLRYAPFHDGADYFVKILEAAKKQGKYWETLDVMYATQQYWASHHKPQPQLIWQFLPHARLDLERLRKDMEDPAIARLIQQDLADAQTLGVTKTPGFFVNGKPLQVFGLEELNTLIESEVKIQYGK